MNCSRRYGIRNVKLCPDIQAILGVVLALAACSASAADWWDTQSPASTRPMIQLDAIQGGSDIGFTISGDQLAPGTELEFKFKPLPGGILDIQSGENARITATENGDSLGIRVWTNDVKQRPATTFTYTPRGKLTSSFAWDDTVASWGKYKFYSRPALTNRQVSLLIQAGADVCDYYVDGRWAAVLPKGTLKVQAKKAAVDAPQLRKVEGLSGFLPVDISSYLNAGVRFPPGSLPTGRVAVIDGVPFHFPAVAANGYNYLDIGQSWFVEDGPFGDRWDSALAGSPTRFKFRVPQDDYNCLYVVAAADNAKFTIPRFTVQFYRPAAGFPHNVVSPDVPLFTAKEVQGLPVGDGHLYVIKVPLNPGEIKEFADLPFMEFELTKDVLPYRCYPDPAFYSQHGAGLRSAVRVFALTLGRAPVKIGFDPVAYGNVWLESEQPAYTVKLSNRTDSDRRVDLNLATRSYDGVEKDARTQSVTVPRQGTARVEFKLKPRRYGHHQVTLSMEGFTQERSMAYLRKRDVVPRDLDYPGFIFGFWNWRGGHHSLGQPDLYRIMGLAGCRVMNAGAPDPEKDPESFAEAGKWGMRCYNLGNLWPVGDPAELIEKLKKTAQPASEISKPTFIDIGTEPYLGVFSHGSLPHYYGEPELPYDLQTNPVVAGVELDAGRGKSYEKIRDGMRAVLPLVRKEFPNARILSPWGDPCFAIPFFMDEQVRPYIDGANYDTAFFDRLPEQQMHQCSLHRLWQYHQEWNRVHRNKPYIPTVEGPCLGPVMPGSLTEIEQANHMMRASLVLAGYGMNHQFSALFVACADYWGEQHYGGGIVGRLATVNPYVAYAAMATLTRHLEPLAFDKWVPTGSLSVFMLQFRDIRNKDTCVHVMWTLRGTRPVAFPGGATVYDFMDNASATNDVILSGSPVFIYGLGDSPKVTLGEPDHRDSVLGAFSTKLANLGQVKWKQTLDDEPAYTRCTPDAIRRFPAEMQVAVVDAPVERGGKALAVTLPKQEKNRGIMPHYTTLVPEKPILIPAFASHISVQVGANSDWGRIVYVLRDAKGEKFVSVGAKGAWNGDDTQGRSVFNFDGWRLLRFELPGNAPWDKYRMNGSTWWGMSGGDGIVDLPLSLEKVFIERREQAIYVNSLEPTSTAPVLLGDLFAEYAKAEDMTPAAIEMSRLRMPNPPGNWEEPNTIAELAGKGTLPATEITGLEEPARDNDGTRGIFHFKEVEGAKEYEIYLSMRQDGRGALPLGKKLQKSGVQVSGFRANTDFYAFVIYRDAKGQQSIPSAPFKLNMKDNFSNK